MSKLINLSILFSIALFNFVSAADNGFVKKSRNGYCHYQTSDFYIRTMNYEKFDTLSLCLASGGEIPPTNTKNHTLPAVKMSRTMICHDKSSAFYEQTKNFVAFENLEACRSNGGK